MRSLLVANRGEIACRVFRTARDMGIRCIAVYVDADADAPFVAAADEALRLPDGGYLDSAAVVGAALTMGADAVHPGYGFLAENAEFAAEVMEAGLVWVGPSPDVIASMGDKLAAKLLAESAGVMTLPSSPDPTADSAVGYPLLVKAAAGGGGKGMRIVEDASDLTDSVAAARREAQSGFGDDTVFLERYVPNSRHIEIQILGDGHGGLVHLGERECSIQRRHQKIIEESPSPVVDDKMRTAMGDAALRLGRAMSYQSAGTVEFLVDNATQEFFFLEVNTRLQVEHPVTEMVTGIDLVREQLRIAAGEALGYDQDDVTFSGHSIEARLYAEDVAAGFLPATGTLHAYSPATEPQVRWDTGVREGSVVTVDFDPMLAKVVASARTRNEAAGRLALALERLHLGGVTTNRDFLAAVLRSEEFLAGDTTTDFIDRVGPAPALCLSGDALRRAATAAALWLQGCNHAGSPVLGGIRSGWRNSRLPAQQTCLVIEGEEVCVRYATRRNGSFDLGEGGEAVIHEWRPDGIDVAVNGHRVDARVTRAGDAVYVQVPQGTVMALLLPRFDAPGAVVSVGGFVAPMPGTVLEVLVAAGDVVKEGQTLVILEAMKMEHHMESPLAGVVAEVKVSAGDQVDNGATLLVFHEDAPG